MSDSLIAASKDNIDDHFAAADDAATRLKEGARALDITTLFIFPLVNRTKSMVRFARELEQQRSELFKALDLYQTIVNSFLTGKTIAVSDRGELRITPLKQKRDHLEWRQLSSGEKQILILLTQALIWERNPVVYVADEPELSLHVTCAGKVDLFIEIPCWSLPVHRCNTLPRHSWWFSGSYHRSRSGMSVPFTRTPTGVVGKWRFYNVPTVWVEGPTDIYFYQPVLGDLACRIEPFHGSENAVALINELVGSDHPYVVILDGDYTILSRSTKFT